MKKFVFRWFPRLSRWFWRYGNGLEKGGRPEGMPPIAWWMLGNSFAWQNRNYRHPVTKKTIWESNPAMRFWCGVGGQADPS